jgi:glycosyltransferase involved in cell wall biosynthesis
VIGPLQCDLLFFSDCCPISNIAAKHIALHRGIPFVTMVHFVAPYLAERFAQCLPIVGKQFAAAREVIAVSTENLQGLRKSFGLAPHRGSVIFPSAKAVFFDTPKDLARRRALRARHQIPDDAVVSFTSARLDPIKGHIFQVHALQHLLAQQPHSKLICVWAGEGDARASLETEVRNRKLQSRIRFVGQQNDVLGWLDAADIFTLTSLSEGMPIAIMEAMARELPVVATPVSGIPEELADTGRLLTDPHTNANGAIVDLIAAWSELARKRETRLTLGRAARTRAELHFRVERMTRAVIIQLQTCIDATRAA